MVTSNQNATKQGTVSSHYEAQALIAYLKTNTARQRYGNDYCGTTAAFLEILMMSCTQEEADEQLVIEMDAIVRTMKAN